MQAAQFVLNIVQVAFSQNPTDASAFTSSIYAAAKQNGNLTQNKEIVFPKNIDPIEVGV